MSRRSLALRFSAARAAPAAAQDWVPQRVAELQVLDKVTARVTLLRATVNQPAHFGTLTIRVAPATPGRRTRCRMRRPGWRSPTAGAPAAAQLVFRGWMFAHAPGVNMLQHPVYDIRILDCR